MKTNKTSKELQSDKATSEKSKSNNKDDQFQENAEEVAQLPFPPHLSCYTALFRLSRCTNFKGIPKITDPVHCSALKAAIREFGNRYSASGPETLDFCPTKIHFDISNDSFLINLWERYDNQSDFGLVFHYGYQVQGGIGKIVYILSKGRVDTNKNVQYCPFPKGENGKSATNYIVLGPQGSNSYKVILQDDFDALARNYLDGISYNGDPINAGTSKHSKMAYHKPAGLFEFYKEYKNEQNVHLYITHGCVYHPNEVEPIHAPCFIFGNADEFFPLDDLPLRPAGRFRLKGLDIGRLCPPNCNTTSPHC